jgi:glycosyltransferase involved in cell wall biosynthesis
MKIVHLCNYIQPALGYQEYYLAREHAKAGHEVAVVTSDRYYPFPNYETTVKKVLGERVIGAKEERVDGFLIKRLPLLFEVGTQVWLKGLEKTIRAINPDVVICHEIGQFNSFRIAGLKKKLKFKLIYDNHASFVCDSPNIFKRAYYKIRNYKMIGKRADSVIGVTDECVNYAVIKFGIPKHLLKMLPLGADSEIFYKDEDKGRALREKYKIASDDFVIIYTGKFLEKKGVSLIIDAAAELKGKEKILFLAVGDGSADYCGKLKELAEEKKVRYLKVDAVANKELPAFYSAASIGVWPVEATIGTIEAIACGLPIICNRFLRERYEAGNGFGVKEWDTAELREKIKYFFENPAETKRMSLLSLKAAEERFSWKAIAEKFLE